MNGLFGSMQVSYYPHVCEWESTYNAATVQALPFLHDSTVRSIQAEPNVPANPRECSVKVGVLPSVIGQKKTVNTVSNRSMGSMPV